MPKVQISDTNDNFRRGFCFLIRAEMTGVEPTWVLSHRVSNAALLPFSHISIAERVGLEPTWR